MLGGFPCSLYEVGRRILTEGKDPIVVWIDTYKLKKKFALRHSSREAFISVLSWFAGRGTALNRIREFIKRKEEIPSRQSFLAAITESLAMLNRTLAQFQSTYVAIQGRSIHMFTRKRNSRLMSFYLNRGRPSCLPFTATTVSRVRVAALYDPVCHNYISQ